MLHTVLKLTFNQHLLIATLGPLFTLFIKLLGLSSLKIILHEGNTKSY